MKIVLYTQSGGSTEEHRCAGEAIVSLVMRLTVVRLLQLGKWELPPQNMK